MFYHPKSAASLFLASLTLLVTSTPLPVDATDTNVELRQLTNKNFNTSIAHDTWYVSKMACRMSAVWWWWWQRAAGSGTYTGIYPISHIPYPITPPTTMAVLFFVAGGWLTHKPSSVPLSQPKTHNPQPNPLNLLIVPTSHLPSPASFLPNRFVEYFSPWCGHCQHFKPTWEKLVKSRDDPPRLSLAQVDCVADAGE
jgi:hypothetical protein